MSGIKARKIISLLVLFSLFFCTMAPVFAGESGGVKSGSGILDRIKTAVVSGVEKVKNLVMGDGKEEENDQVTEVKAVQKKGLLTDIDSLTKKKATKTTSDEEGGLLSNIDTVTKKESTSLEDANSTEDEEEVTDGEDHWSKLDAGVMMVGKGVWIYGLEILADEGFKVGMSDDVINELNIKENYGATVAVIYQMATLEFDPFENDFIREIHIRMNLIGIFLIFLFIIMGALDVNICAAVCAKNRSRAYILNNRYHLPINEYGVTLVEANLALAGGYAVLWVISKTELLFTKLIMLQILDRIVPTGDSVLMYLMMSICYIIMGLALATRILIIAMFSCSYIVFVALYCFGITREVAVSAFWYFVKVTFLRTAIVGVTVVGVGVISSIKVNPGLNPFLGIVQGFGIMFLVPLLYAALILILCILSIKVLFGITNVLRTSRRVYRMSRGKGYI